MNLINWWSSIGLLLDIVGVLFLFEYGLPSKIEEEAVRGISESQDILDERERKNLLIIRMSYTGLGLICTGFIFQLIGTNIEFIKTIF